MTEETVRWGRRLRVWIVTAVLCAGMVGASHAASETGSAVGPNWASAPEQIAVTGIITSIAGDKLRVSYGVGDLTVSMAGWDWYDERTQRAPPRLSVGENVTVTGAVSDRLFSGRMLRAQSVHVEDRHSFFVASSPKAGGASWSLRAMPVPPFYGRDLTTVTLVGEVARITGDEFSLDVGNSVVSVGTGSMSYNPLDKIGAQRVQAGDWVQVSGRLDNRLFEERRLDATRITSVFRMGVHAM